MEGLKNRGFQEQSAYWGRQLPYSFKRRMKHLLNKTNEETNQNNPSNIDLKLFRNNCFCDLLGPCPVWGEIFEVSLGGEMGHGTPYMKRLNRMPRCRDETSLPARSLGLCQLSFSWAVSIFSYFSMGLIFFLIYFFSMSRFLSLLALFYYVYSFLAFSCVFRRFCLPCLPYEVW